jgi:diacylglycerol kinase family enzyme
LSDHGWTPTKAPKRPVLFVNPSSGGGKAARAEVSDRARERGIDVVLMTSDRDPAALAREAVARGADALGVAGGDGSLAVVAAAAAAHGLPFTCIPAGTRNHFARDLGIDRQDLIGALDAFTDGMERMIDLAEVNDRVYVNNVSLGIYGDAVRRPTYRDTKVRTVLRTAEEVLGPSAGIPKVHVVDDLGREHIGPAVLLVSNNPYAVEPPATPGTRPALDSGRLGVLVVDAPRPDRPPRARAWSAPRLDVDAAEPVHAGIDGEAVDLIPPLGFVIRPAVLRVRISAGHPSVSARGDVPSGKGADDRPVDSGP